MHSLAAKRSSPVAHMVYEGEGVEEFFSKLLILQDGINFYSYSCVAGWEDELFCGNTEEYISQKNITSGKLNCRIRCILDKCSHDFVNVFLCEGAEGVVGIIIL